MWVTGWVAARGKRAEGGGGGLEGVGNRLKRRKKRGSSKRKPADSNQRKESAAKDGILRDFLRERKAGAARVDHNNKQSLITIIAS